MFYSIVSECLQTNSSHISRAHISKCKCSFNVKSTTYYFHVKTKILADFQIWITVPSKNDRQKDQSCYFVILYLNNLHLLSDEVVDLPSCENCSEEHIFISYTEFYICTFFILIWCDKALAIYNIVTSE